MAGILRAAPDRVGASSVDELAQAVDLFVMRAVETMCLAEAAVPEQRRTPVMQMRLDEAKRNITRLEDLLIEMRRSTSGPAA